MPRKGDPDNKIRDGLHIDDERTSVFEKHEDGSTSIHRHFGGEWHEYPVGGGDDSERDDND
jgi:hypothetical protein